MDQSDSLEALEHIKANLKPAPAATKGFPKARTIGDVLGKAVNTGRTVRAVLEQQFHTWRYSSTTLSVSAKRDQSFKRSNNMMDYDDLLLNSVKLLEEHPDVRKEIAARWTHVLVDEYQDTNELQARMLVLLAADHGNVMAVGDDCQSIYSFRGATIKNIIDFPAIFPGTRIVKLEENYRSTAPILALTNAVIQKSATDTRRPCSPRGRTGPGLSGSGQTRKGNRAAS